MSDTTKCSNQRSALFGSQQKILIGLTGSAGVGKDTARAILERIGFVGLAFADPLRAMLRTLFNGGGISGKYIDNRGHKEIIIPELGVSYRHMAQTLGTEWARGLQPDFWLRMMDARFAQETQNSVVISDVRFANEAVWVRKHGGVVWRIERHNVPPVRGHVSEIESQSIIADTVIPNHSRLSELESVIFEAVRSHQHTKDAEFDNGTGGDIQCVEVFKYVPMGG